MAAVAVPDANDLAWDALVVSRIVDAASLQPRVVSAATVDLPHASAFIATGSYLVVSGRPDLAMPDLATTAYVVPVVLQFPDRGPLMSPSPYRPARSFPSSRRPAPRSSCRR